MSSFLASAMVLGVDSALDQLHRSEQAAACSAPRLPSDIEGRAQWEAIGFVFGEPDGLWCAVQMPDGWALRPSDHPLWTDIVDGHGRVRGQYFYKDSFFEKEAWLDEPLRRFVVRRDGDVPDPDKTVRYTVFDRSEQREIHWTVLAKFGNRPRLEVSRWCAREAERWLDAQYPRHEDPAAYWN